MRLEPFYDQSHLVRESIGSVRDAILIGIVLALDCAGGVSARLVLVAGGWAGDSCNHPDYISLSKDNGQSFNLMTLGGLAAAVGLVIDDAIVVVENIVLHRDSGETRAIAVRKALHEITRPLVGSTITPIVVFLPLYRSHWSDGKLLPRACDHHDRCPAYFAAAGTHMDSKA